MSALFTAVPDPEFPEAAGLQVDEGHGTPVAAREDRELATQLFD